ncbi:TauD/TfdA family dioxygenase [Amycolatopsis anabasis]|uniref:TauD/TfdA family dioxygenase n=1 Tax=Amycolatopsis anabasis TaxID=1840409 RepID=UPI00131B54D2|nr:TauD/TfdA family dioxygenase [Amycolatopsis anabasis]
MNHSPLSILSQTDFNQRPIPLERLEQTFRDMLTEHGYVLMTNVPDDFDPVRFCRRLGGFVPNYNGSVVGDVRPEPGMDDVYHAGNTRPLTPHTEGYDFEVLPPRYIALWCVQPITGGGGETTLADTRPWVQAMTDAQREVFEKTEYDWKTTDGVKRLGLDLHTRHPILAENDGTTIVRFSCNNLIRDDEDPAAQLQHEWHQRFDEEHVAIDYGANDMLVWDNWRLLHARNAFRDRGRHLRRIQIAAS